MLFDTIHIIYYGVLSKFFFIVVFIIILRILLLFPTHCNIIQVYNNYNIFPACTTQISSHCTKRSCTILLNIIVQI